MITNIEFDTIPPIFNPYYISNSFIIGFLTAAVLFTLAFHAFHRHSRRYFSTHQAASLSQSIDGESLRRIFKGALPAWIVSPSANQQLDWVNKVNQILWPQFSRAISKPSSITLLDELINDERMAFLRPKWMIGSGINVLGISPGTVPFKVTSVEVVSPKDGREVVIDFEWSWVSDASAKICLKSLDVERLTWVDKALKMMNKVAAIKVHIRDIVAHGKLRFALRPLIDDLPVAGAVNISLLGIPEFSYRVDVLGGNPFFLPGLESWLDNFLQRQVLKSLIYPEGYIHVLLTDKATVQLRPRGLLTVKIIEAKEVPRVDLFGKCDPFVKLWVRENAPKSSTTIRHRTLSPIWNEEFIFVIHEPQHQNLSLQLLDNDLWVYDDELGWAEIPLRSLDLSGAVNDFWIPITLRTGKRKVYKSKADKRVMMAEQPDGSVYPSKRWREEIKEQKRQSTDHDDCSNGGGTATNNPAIHLNNNNNNKNDDSKSPFLVNGASFINRLGAVFENTMSSGGVVRGGGVQQHMKGCRIHVAIEYNEFSNRDLESVASGNLDMVGGEEEEEEADGGGTSVSGRVGDADFESPHLLSTRGPISLQDKRARHQKVQTALRGGLLMVHINRAENLVSKRFNVGFTRNMKIVLKVGNKKRFSERSNGTFLHRRNPVFQETLELLLDGDEAMDKDAVVSVELWVSHFMWRDGFKGRVSLPLAEVIQGASTSGGEIGERDWRLEGVESGRLHMALEWLPALGNLD